MSNQLPAQGQPAPALQVIAMRRTLTLALASAALLLSSLAFAGGASAATLAATTTCSNGVDNTGGLGLICEVTIDNTFTATGGTATVTVRECHGAAGAPAAACTTTTQALTEPVTAVTQCNDSINGGGGTLRCSVVVTNHFVGVSSATAAATVNQCVGSGDGITTGCDPFPATTTGAAITQCNGSANGGTLVGLNCTATGTSSASHVLTINQCNGSANGGGGLVICSANVTNSAGAVVPTPAPTATAPAGQTAVPTAGLTQPPTDSGSPTIGAAPSGVWGLLAGISAMGLIGILVAGLARVTIVDRSRDERRPR